MKISDELREWADVHCGEECEEYLGLLADRIDAEMVELPKDADGEVIHVGDTVYSPVGKECCVKEIAITQQGVCVKCKAPDTTISTFFSYDLAHERPDSWERIAQDMEDWAERYKFKPDKVIFNDALDFAGRIRKLAKEGTNGRN